MTLALRCLIASTAILCFANVVGADEPPQELARWLKPQKWERDMPGPVVSLGKAGDFDDTHIFTPMVAQENGRFMLWYCGSRGGRNRIYRLGLATGVDGKHFDKYPENPVYQFPDGERSIITPSLLHNGDGAAVRENNKLRMWFSSTSFGRSGRHTIHESTSVDGIHWAEASEPLLEAAYCPTVLKTEKGYEMWYGDVSKRPWVIRHAVSQDGTKWTVSARTSIFMSQAWEADVFVYPTVLKIDGVYIMWYGSYFNSVHREKTAIGFAASLDGEHWYKYEQNPVMLPDPKREWESNYVGTGCVMRMADGSFRYWYASRKAPPFDHLYFAINTAKWAGPAATAPVARMPFPPKEGATGTIDSADLRRTSWVDVLEVVDRENAILRIWYMPADGKTAQDATFDDVWVRGADTADWSAGSPAKVGQTFRVAGSKSYGTTCGSRVLALLVAVEAKK